MCKDNVQRTGLGMDFEHPYARLLPTRTLQQVTECLFTPVSSS